MRNSEWTHMFNDHVISMPDKWEYPWYAAWDLAFHTIALSSVDVDFAKEQLDLMLQEFFLHPTGQIPAYEWNFSDVNPPVHAWATIFLYRTEQALRGEGDLEFLKRSFAKLVLNFSQEASCHRPLAAAGPSRRFQIVHSHESTFIRTFLRPGSVRDALWTP
jgi:mannosylglycerate hydrolase MGH1-like protein